MTVGAALARFTSLLETSPGMRKTPCVNETQDCGYFGVGLIAIREQYPAVALQETQRN
jgi:hypothetical protein